MVGCQVVVKETTVYDSDLDSDGNAIYDDENNG